jgi:dinuclear metal center YbgI/SA1388 family protein
MTPRFLRDEIVETANDYLALHEFKDYGPMGLQFAGQEEVRKIVTGVSISQDLIEAAIDVDADMIIVHHGLFWNNEPRYIDKRMERRLEMLGDHSISLLAYHLCLDAHPAIGNNVAAVASFDGELRKFGDIGWGTKLKRPLKRQYIEDEWDGIKYLYGPTQIRKIAAVVGGAPFYIHDAVREGYDLFITGEAAEPSQALAKELGINFVAFGHYNSETAGVRSLGRILGEMFGIEHEFIDIPNEV